MCNLQIETSHSGTILNFLRDHNDLAMAHPNQAATSGTFLGMPDTWVLWSKSHPNLWRNIVHYYQSSSDIPNTELPDDMKTFLRTCSSLELPRESFYRPDRPSPERVSRVTPKKLHEVHTMASYIGSLFSSMERKPWVVDIGAGQGYLSRALSSSPNNFNVLALDSNASQTAGSLSRKDWLSQTNPESQGEIGGGTLTHKTIFIDDHASLSSAIEEWVHQNASPSEKIPIALVGLHCCGDLTPAILRFIRAMLNSYHGLYELVGCVIVGCCYNMCSPDSFPLSRNVARDLSETGPLSLETQHLHLATQSPRTWILDTEEGEEVGPGPISLSIRKVVYRALLARRLPESHRPDKDAVAITDVDWRTKRVGRLGNTAYKDFPTFLKAARGKLGLKTTPSAITDQSREVVISSSDHQASQNSGDMAFDMDSDLSAEEAELGRSLEVLYVLRCMLGPAVESLIALDRYHYLKEILFDQCSAPTGNTHEVHLVNLFDQSTGSLRNLGLVWKLSNETGI
ncbi:hypothetical protein CPB86DRAFT_797268 [Serendipita vermifera]|nr:hypothetical protein CPB86DRAFT_797268 [Serendipita vermifera]